MPRQHTGAPATIACIWPGNSNLNDEIAQRLICWAGEENVFTTTDVTFHFEVLKTDCTTYGPLTFTNGGLDVCPLGDDLTVNAADPLDPEGCIPPAPPGGTEATQEGDNQFSGDNSFSGTSTFTGVSNFSGIANFSNDVNISGETLFTDAVEIDQPNVSTIGLVIKQLNTVITTDANMLEVYYKTFNTLRLNELGLLRVLTPPASTGFGKEGETTAQFHAGTSTSKAVRILDHTGAENAFIRGNGTATFLGAVDAPNITKGAWVALTVDSPTVAGRYVAGNGVTTYVPAARIVGGDKVELSGSITVNSSSGTGDVICSAMPAGTFPAKEVDVFGGIGGAGAQVRVSAAGVMTIQRSAQIGTLSLDGCFYRLV